MAIGSATNITGQGSCSFLMALGENWSVHITTIDDATDATTNIGAPENIDEAGFHWVKRPTWARYVIPYMRCAVGVTAMSTKPIVRVYGAWATPGSTGAIPADSDIARLDSAATGGAGITLDFDNTNDLVTTTYQFGGLSSLTAINLQGCHYFATPVATAGVVSGGSGAVLVRCLVLGG